MMRYFGLFAVVVIAFGAPASAGPESIGAVNKLQNVAYGQQVESQKLKLSLADQVYQNETLETESDASLQVGFLDGTTVQLEGASQLVLDQYVYDPATSSGTAALNFGAGVFRFVSGQMNHDGVTLETGATTIGIRGTALAIRVGTTGATVVDVIKGAIVVHPKNGDKDVMVAQGQRVTVTSAGVDAVVTPIPADLTGSQTEARTQTPAPAQEQGPAEAQARDEDQDRASQAQAQSQSQARPGAGAQVQAEAHAQADANSSHAEARAHSQTGPQE